MNRCLHITIQEGSAAASRHSTHIQDRKDSEDRTWTDPQGDPVSLRVDDPRWDDLMERPDASTADSGTPSADSSSSSFPSGGSGGCGEVVATACSCCCAPASQDTAAPGKTTPHPFIGLRDYSGFVIVRMAAGIEHSEAETLSDLAEKYTPKLTGLQAVLELPSGGTLVSRPLVELYTQSHENPRLLKRNTILGLIHELESKTANTTFPPLHSLASYWRLDLREHPDLVEKIVAQLNDLAEVDLAYRELAATDPGEANGQRFSEDQGYLDDAPTGIGASWAWDAAMAPPPTIPLITLCDLEQGWNLDHRDLQSLDNGQPLADPLFGVNRAKDGKSPGHHGTAVLGQLAATGNSPFGVKGIAAGLGRVIIASHYKFKTDSNLETDSNFKKASNGHVTSAMVQALSSVPPSPPDSAPLKRGDILLIEVQRGRLPVEADEADFDAIRLAAGLGIIVVEAAGNGGFDLDAYSDPHTGRSLRRGDWDSGAILVGAAHAGLPHDRAPLSNYGSRLDCYGWGEAVTTCGYGDLAGTGTTDFYTNRFSGTSSASPIIAGAAALLQSLHQTRIGMRLDPRAMREILADPTTGTRQGPKVPGNIGVMPDLKAIVRDRLQLVPDVYLRRSIGDDGAPPAPGDEISSSPDILVWTPGPGNPPATPDSRFGEGSRRENTPAPGELVKPAKPNNIYVRLRNRGLGAGDAHLKLFASPAATLITPERWIPVGAVNQSIPQGGVLQGDTLFVAGPVSWTPPSLTSLSLKPAPPWSFLAVLTRPGEGPSGPLGPPWFDWASGLPPGPPYFDWTAYRAFLRGPGVAWRNTHRVVSTTTSAALTFWIAGTPDRARSFDFEVIQRLPAGATVTLQVLPALAAKLQQHQPLLKKVENKQGSLDLPKRPRTAIRGVELAAGAYANATFTFTDGGSALTAGHSVAIRQLWRGEEVGRITWIFGPDS